MNPLELAYRKTAVEGTSGFGLLIALYDTLAGNLRRAAIAQRSNDIHKRCQEVNHALRVIGYLEDWIDREGGGELALQLVAFYAAQRAKLIQAQARGSADILEREMDVLLAIRGTWQDLEARGVRPGTPALLRDAQVPWLGAIARGANDVQVVRVAQWIAPVRPS